MDTMTFINLAAITLVIVLFALFVITPDESVDETMPRVLGQRPQ